MKRAVAVTFVFLLAAFILFCHRETEQDKIKKVITGIQKSVEEKDIKEVLSRISKTYQDQQGNNYETIKGLLLVYFYQYPKISMYITNLDVISEDASAKASFQAVLSGRTTSEPSPAILPETLGMYAFDLSLRKESGEWKVFSAKWERVEDARGAVR